MELGRYLQINTTDPELARRGRLLNILVLGVAVVTVLILAATLVAQLAIGAYGLDEVLLMYVFGPVLLVGLAAIYWLNRTGRQVLASYLFLLLFLLVLSFADSPSELVSGRSTVLYFLPIAMASMILVSHSGFYFAALCSLAVIGLSVWASRELNLVGIASFYIVALISWLSARSLERALGDLRRTNLELDQRVDERTRDLAEALAREHAESSKNQAILEGIADGVIVFDEEGKAIVANPAIGRIIGRSADEILGLEIETLMGQQVCEEDRGMITNLLKDRELRRPSVKFAWGDKTLSVSFAPVHARRGDVTGTVAVFRDFTREAEVDRMKSDFVSIVSHELRTPLTSIKGYLDLVLMGASGPINRQQGSFLEIAKANSERLHTLVSDLLDLSRIESGKADLDVQVVSLSEIVDHVTGSLQNEFSERNLTLTLDVPADLPEIFGDPGRIAQVLTNLLSNAYKYTREGGATVRVRQVRDALQVDIIDTGVGIANEDREKLFTRFFRGEDSQVRQQPGTGLGLSITKSLVEMHGGKIWVDSNRGNGTVFSFTLPLPPGLVEVPAAEGARPGEQPAVPIPSGPWVLVVDDSPDVAQLFQHQLQKAGYRVTVVNQGSRVVEVARQLKPELITLDLLMDVDGLTVLQRLKADPATAEIPVVIISVVPRSKESLVLGAADYLVKPLEERELLDCIHRVLDQLDGNSRNKILVVDDEIDIVGWLKHSLTHYGFQVAEAYDGVQALEAVASDKPDLILLDLKMPRMDGRTTVRKLREQEESRHIPVIVLSANPIRDDVERAQMLGMGVRQFLNKPVTIEQLVAEVQKLLGVEEPRSMG
jgi:PAS domain S-box-containing protein